MTTVLSSTLVRFVSDGLFATIDSYRDGQLPLHRFAWELHTGIETLAELSAAPLTLTRLRWLHRTIANLHSQLVENRRAELTSDEEHSLTVTLVSLRTALASLTPHNPLDPTGAAAPTGELQLRRCA